MSTFLLTTVIYTDQLEAVRAFYERHFKLTIDVYPHSILVTFYGNAAIEYVDAGWAEAHATPGVVVRWTLPLTDLEHERLTTEGATCGPLTTAHWGDNYGETVRYFELTDPAGTRLQLYEPHFGEKRSLTATADGREARKIHEQGS